MSRKSQKDKKIDDKRKSDRDKKKLRMKRTKDTWQVGDTTLADDEKKYFETLEKVFCFKYIYYDKSVE